MSNILKTIEYLRDNPKRFIRIINSITNTKIGNQDIFFSDIPNEDLGAYIKNNIGPIARPTFAHIELRFKDGDTSRKKDSFSVEIQPETSPLPMLPAVPQQTQQVQHAQPDYFGGGAGLGQSFGLGLPQFMEMNRKADRLADKEEQLQELKADFKEVKHENKLLEIENRELKTKLSTAEAGKEMAIQLVKLENKSFYDSPAFEKIMEQAPQLLSGIVAMKTGGLAPTGALGNPDLSATHNELIDYISSNLNEHQANYIGSVCGLMTNQGFSNELNALIKKYGTV